MIATQVDSECEALAQAPSEHAALDVNAYDKAASADAMLSQGQSAEQGVIRLAKSTALRYLVRRDYSRLELYQKLIAKGMQSVLVNQVLDELQSSGYQSDERYAEMYLRSRLSAGDGPFKIKIALCAKGVCDSLVEGVIDKLAVDWFSQAKRVRDKRFGQSPPLDLTDLGKQIRYLKRKGFEQEQIDSALKGIDG